MKVSDLILIFRTEADDFGTPALWKDDEIARYLAEAEEEAAIRKHLLYDDYTVAITTYAITAGTSRVKRDPRMFEVAKARLTRPGSRAEPHRLELVDRDTIDGLQPNWKRDRGTPDFAIVGDTSITLAAEIDRAWTLELEGYRTPLKPINGDNLDAAPEIAPQHHRFLVYWALHRAYQKADSETLNKDKSASALWDFEQYFGYRNQANQGERNRSDTPHRNRIW